MVILPLVSVFLLFGVLCTRTARIEGEDLRLFWIEAVTLAAGGLAVVSEGLSLIHALTTEGVAAFWGVVDVVLLAILWPRWSVLRGRLSLSLRWREGRLPWEKAILAGLSGLALLLLATALLSQPNNVDSLLYHMPRVAHWSQGRSLAPYPTQYGNQIWYPPFAEEVILHSWLLSGGDGAAPLVQWFSFVSLLIIVGALTRFLGGFRGAELAAVAFFASIPMTVLEATSTQNDLVATHWLLVLACFVVLSLRRPLDRLETICLGTAAALGILTKATMYVLEAPLLLWFAIGLWKKGPSPKFQHVAAAIIPSLLLNAGYWLRNLSTSGGLFGPASFVDTTTYAFSPLQALARLPSSVLSAIAVHFATPLPDLNDRIVNVVRSLAGQADPSADPFTLVWRWNHEDFATAPVHVVLALIAVGFVMLKARGLRPAWNHTLALLASAVGFAAIIRLSGNPVGVRYHLPLLASAAPLAGIAAERLLRGPGVRLVSWVMLVLAVPYTLFNASRPLIGMTPEPRGLEIPCLSGCTAVGSLLEAPPRDVLFANLRGLQPPYTEVAEASLDLGCGIVGLRLDSHNPEYFFWELLGPGEVSRIESVYSLDELRPLIDPNFRPCAIICTICSGRTFLHGLPRVFNAEHVSLYAGEGFQPDPDAEPGGE